MRSNATANFRLLILALAGAFCAGCAEAPVFHGRLQYLPLTSPAASTLPVTVAILPLEDKRSRVDYDHDVFAFIPGVLWSTAKKDRIEEGPYNGHIYSSDGKVLVKTGEAPAFGSAHFNWSSSSNMRRINMYGYPERFLPVEFIQKGMLDEFEHLKIFQNVGPVRSEADAQGADLVLRGELLSTAFNTTYIDYGFCLISLFVQEIAPFPGIHLSQELIFRLELARPGDKKALWTMIAKAQATGARNWNFYNSGIAGKYTTGPDAVVSIGTSSGVVAHQGQMLNDALAEAMAQVMPSLTGFLAKQPRSFWDSGSEAR